MGNYKIKLDDIDQKLDVKVVNVAIGAKHFSTPYKALNTPQNNCVLEIYQKVDEKMIIDSREGLSPLDKIPFKCKKDTINMVIPSYGSTTISDSSLRDFESRIHPNTDVVIIPRWEGILQVNNETKLFDDMWSITKRYIEEVRRINGKLIMGNLPLNRPQSVIDRLVDGYVSEGITSFVLDYEQCGAPKKRYLIRNIEKELSDFGYSEDSLLYSINMRKSHDYNGIMPADDLLSLIDGVNILGNYHLGGGGGNKDYVKVFNQSEWTYISLPLEGRNSVDVALDNHNKMNIEAELVKKEIIENGSALKMIRTKKGATEYTKSVSQTTLNFGKPSWG